ncbi:hypothetical protein VTJ04DRAFT_2889 [Mycothermus thermophilus]|uniref:uncharacterized protein n=1 Tax=Humicola insolens TaxID=85995 RepID=UPI0037444CF2
MPLPSSLPHTAPRQNQPPITPDKEGGDAIAGARQDAKPHQPSFLHPNILTISEFVHCVSDFAAGPPLT